VDVLATHEKATECCMGCTPVPERAIVVGEFAALLVRVTLPAALPLAAGVKVAFNVALCPVFRVVPVGTPPALKPGPPMLTFEIVAAEPPELVSVTLRVLLLPTFTLLKLRLGGLLVNCPGVLTVKKAALLVTVPVELVAVMFEVPATTPVARPDVLIVATEGVAELHVAVLVRFCVLVSL
jgi:hypothetical protein